MLVFDAKVTNESYQSWTFKNEREREIVDRYNASVRFVGTMSGNDISELIDCGVRDAQNLCFFIDFVKGSRDGNLFSARLRSNRTRSLGITTPRPLMR